MMDVRTILERARGLVRSGADQSQELEAKIAQAEAEKAELIANALEQTKTQTRASSQAFVDGLVRAGSLVPAQSEAATALLFEAYEHDAFAEGSLVGRVKDLLASTPNLGLTAHQISSIPGGVTAVPANGAVEEAQEKARLLAMTDLGKQTLKTKSTSVG